MMAYTRIKTSSSPRDIYSYLNYIILTLSKMQQDESYIHNMVSATNIYFL